MDSPSIEGFHGQLDFKIMYGNSAKLVSIYSFVFKK